MSLKGPTEVESAEGYWMIDMKMYDIYGYGVVYLLDTTPPVMIDTGMGRHVDWIFDVLNQWGVASDEPLSVLLTHVHLDHAGGVGKICEAFPNANVYVHERGAPHLHNPDRLISGTKRAVGEMWQYYTEPNPVHRSQIIQIKDDEVIEVGGRRFSAWAAPGHAPHQLVYHDHTADILFCGDAMGIRIPGSDRVIASTPPPQFDLAQSRSDVARIANCGPRSLAYTHHGYQIFDQRVADRYDRTLEKFVMETTDALRSQPIETVIEKVRLEYDTEAIWGAEKTRAEASLNVRGVAAMDP
jgi:glyoxylase-like metal-dependent hydrolase (beta-lactamase superfamily II)